jgi:hypothetical protein
MLKKKNSNVGYFNIKKDILPGHEKNTMIDDEKNACGIIPSWH